MGKKLGKKSKKLKTKFNLLADELVLLREEVDLLDEELLRVLSIRKKVVGKILRLKKRLNLPERDIKREKEMYAKRRKLAKKMKLNTVFVENLFKSFVGKR
ncbi:MAG: chorismate mutase [Nanoarchaeota archaeon]